MPENEPAAPASDLVPVPDFDALYRSDDDPWQVLNGAYEARKLEILMASLSRRHYRRAWDPACGVGALVARLAGCTDDVLATDGSARAVELTQRACGQAENVRFAVSALPNRADAGDAAFDLIVISEFLYYLPPDDRAAALMIMHAAAAADAEIASVHWRPHPHDAYCSGADVEAEIAAFLVAQGWRQVVDHQEPDFVLSTFVRGERP